MSQSDAVDLELPLLHCIQIPSKQAIKYFDEIGKTSR